MISAGKRNPAYDGTPATTNPSPLPALSNQSIISAAASSTKLTMPHPVHESIRTTDIYQHADLGLKERALARTAPTQPQTPRGRYRPPDDLLAFLEAL
jgi:hypothetical protein